MSANAMPGFVPRADFPVYVKFFSISSSGNISIPISDTNYHWFLLIAARRATSDVAPYMAIAACYPVSDVLTVSGQQLTTNATTITVSKWSNSTAGTEGVRFATSGYLGGIIISNTDFTF